ncbi:MAG: FAD:protein FMN transferase [Chloroflexi bacterium]|nr:FAD:protein FMN transferase [Chloroflexota bacterium]
MPFVAVHSPLLGREVQIRVEADPEAALAADAAAVAEFERLSQIFSIYSETSELSRWRRGEVEECSPELTQVLAASKAWHATSAGAFHPAIGALRLRWLRAAAEDRLPDPGELAELVEACATLPFTVTDGRVSRIADCSGVDLNAIAKGFIVDRAAAAAIELPGVDAVMINAAGDLRHLGDGSVLVGVDDADGPLEPAPPRWRVRLSRAGLSTSGAIRRGFEIGGAWLGHVLDPRTGWPVAHTSSASVIAADAMTADALVTVLGVLEPEAALAHAQVEGIACLVVTADGRQLRSPAWPAEAEPA